MYQTMTCHTNNIPDCEEISIIKSVVKGKVVECQWEKSLN